MKNDELELIVVPKFRLIRLVSAQETVDHIVPLDQDFEAAEAAIIAEMKKNLNTGATFERVH